MPIFDMPAGFQYIGRYDGSDSAINDRHSFSQIGARSEAVTWIY
jgi:hypothetical protein